MSLLDIFCGVRRRSVHGFCLQKRFEIWVGHESIFYEPEAKRTGASYYEKDPVDETMSPLLLWPAGQLVTTCYSSAENYNASFPGKNLYIA
jgi:hypothetical protein